MTNWRRDMADGEDSASGEGKTAEADGDGQARTAASTASIRRMSGTGFTR